MWGRINLIASCHLLEFDAERLAVVFRGAKDVDTRQKLASSSPPQIKLDIRVAIRWKLPCDRPLTSDLQILCLRDVVAVRRHK